MDRSMPSFHALYLPPDVANTEDLLADVGATVGLQCVLEILRVKGKRQCGSAGTQRQRQTAYDPYQSYLTETFSSRCSRSPLLRVCG